MKKAAFIAVLTALVSFNSLAKTEATDVLGVRSQLRTEEHRQRRAGRLVSGAAREIEWLLKDLQDNQLYKKQDGEVTAAMVKQLLDLSSGRIPEAASILGRAREDVSAAGPHITSAEAEVQKILQDLARILKETTSGLAEDKVLNQLKELIDDEEELKDNTQNWGRKVVLDKNAAKADTGRLHRLQSAVIPQYADFFSLLEKTKGEVSDKDAAKNLAAAVSALGKSKPDLQIRKAAKGIQQTKPFDAIQAQEAVIAALKEAYDILSAGVEDEAFWKKIMDQLLKDQKDLQNEIKDADRGKFDRQQSDLVAKQMDINKAMQQLAQSPQSSPQSSPPPSSQPPSSPPPQATEAMPEGDPMRLMEDDKPEDIKNAEAKAAKDQEEAKEALDKAQEAMNVAQDKLEEGNQEQAEKAAQEAVEALEEAQEAMEKSATSSAELASLLKETLPNAGEEPPPTSPMAASPGDLPEVSPTDSESETQEDRSSDEAAETAAEGEGEETGDIAGSEMPEGEGEMPGSVGKSETSTGEGDTPIGEPGAEGKPPEKTNPKDPNKPESNKPAPALFETGQGKKSKPPEGEMPPPEDAVAGDELGGHSETEASGKNYELKALAANVFKRGTKKGGLQEYLPQLPAEYRKQIKAYYEVLAQ